MDRTPEDTVIDYIDATVKIDSIPEAADPIVRADLVSQLREAIAVDVGMLRMAAANRCLAASLMALYAARPRA